jgi:hypothetical protein
LEPIYYLIDKYLKEEKTLTKGQVLVQCNSILQEVQATLRALREAP